MGEQGQNDRPVRDCQHSTVHHEHGTPDGYAQDRCRCPACTRANTVHKQQRRVAIAHGTYDGLVDAGAVREHLQRLRDAGHGIPRIAHLARVGRGTVNALVYGEPSRGLSPSGQVLADTAQRLFAVDPVTAPLAGGSRVPATGPRRRLQALACTGWSTPALAANTTLPRRTLTRLQTGVTPNVTVATARTVAALYERFRLVPPPLSTSQQHTTARHTAAAAQAAGWRAPHTWYDLDLDLDLDLDPGPLPHCASRPSTEGDTDPRPGPVCDRHDNDLDGQEGEDYEDYLLNEPDVDEVAVERAMHGMQLRLTPEERLEAVARLTRRGVSAREIAERLHTTSRTVVRLRSTLRDTSAA